MTTYMRLRRNMYPLSAHNVHRDLMRIFARQGGKTHPDALVPPRGGIAAPYPTAWRDAFTLAYAAGAAAYGAGGQLVVAYLIDYVDEREEVVTFEFDTGSGVTPGNVQLDIQGCADAAAIATAVNGVIDAALDTANYQCSTSSAADSITIYSPSGGRLYMYAQAVTGQTFEQGNVGYVPAGVVPLCAGPVKRWAEVAGY